MPAAFAARSSISRTESIEVDNWNCATHVEGFATFNLDHNAAKASDQISAKNVVCARLGTMSEEIRPIPLRYITDRNCDQSSYSEAVTDFEVRFKTRRFPITFPRCIFDTISENKTIFQPI